MIDTYRMYIALSIMALLCSVLLGVRFDDAVLGTDFAQTISVAKNLLDGNGLSTSLIYYEAHYQLGMPPVPQTVFPPGYSILLALLALTGASYAWSAFTLCLASYVLTGFLVAALVRRISTSELAGVLAGSAWLLVTQNWANVLECQSEVLFIFSTIGSVYCLSCWESSQYVKRRWLLAAATLAASAFLVRYQGAFFVLSICAVMLLRATVERSARSVQDFFLVCAITGLTVLGLFLRNAMIAGDFSGGPMALVHRITDPMQVGLAAYHELSKILGITIGARHGIGFNEISFAMAFIVFVWVTVRYSLWRRLVDMLRRDSVLQISLVYILVTSTGLIYLCTYKSIGYMQARYLSTLIPFFIFLLAALGRSVAPGKGLPRNCRVVVLGIFVMAFFSGQARTASEQLEEIATGWGMEEIRSALQTEYLGGTVQSFLSSEIDNGNNVLAHRSQITGQALDRAAFGLPPSLVTSRVFRSEEIRAMAALYNWHFVVFYPGLYDEDARNNSNRVIFSDIVRDDLPLWLQRRMTSDEIELFEIIR